MNFIPMNCNAFSLFSSEHYENILQGKVNGIIVHENLSWKIHGGIFLHGKLNYGGGIFCCRVMFSSME